MKFIMNSEIKYLVYAVLLCVLIGGSILLISNLSLVEILITVAAIMLITVLVFSRTALNYTSRKALR